MDTCLASPRQSAGRQRRRRGDARDHADRPRADVEADTSMAMCGRRVRGDLRRSAGGAGCVVRRHARTDVLQFGRIGAGRARLSGAWRGGMQTPPVLGSRATHLVSRMGGLNGRALRPAIVLPIGTRMRRRVRDASRAALTLPPRRRARLRVMPGPQDDWFAGRCAASHWPASASACRRDRTAWAIGSKDRRSCARDERTSRFRSRSASARSKCRPRASRSC